MRYKLISALRAKIEPARNPWSSWLKVAGVALGVSGRPMTPVDVRVAALSVGNDLGTGGFKWFLDWKVGPAQLVLGTRCLRCGWGHFRDHAVYVFGQC